MKRTIFITFIIAAGIFSSTSCGMKKENESLMQKNDSLQSLITSQQLMIDNQTTEINDYIGFIVDIQKSLDAISQKQQELTGQSTEQTVITDNQKRAQLKTDINNLYEEILANRKKVENLNYQLSKSKKETKNLETLVANLQTQIEQRDKDLSDLRQLVEQQNTQIAGLQKDVNEKTQQIKNLETTVSQQIEAMNAAWYYVATKSDLRNKNIIDKSGKIITTNNNNFTKIDITKTTVIPVNSKKVRIVSAHPLNSYEFIYEGKIIKSINIKDSESFWKLGNHFVAIIK